MSEKKLGMLIDLSLCVGCNACAIACKQENDVPVGGFNTWVESWDVDDNGQIRRANVPKQCNHCDNAPCVSVCPTGASYKNEDGLVVVDPERCIGCKYCMAACPYQVRWQNEAGEVDKCTFCDHRTSVGLLPACVSTCITRARIFGDTNDPNSEISKKMAEAKTDVIYADLNMGPHVYYIGLDEIEGMPRVSAIHKGGNVFKPFEGR